MLPSIFFVFSFCTNVGFGFNWMSFFFFWRVAYFNNNSCFNDYAISKLAIKAAMQVQVERHTSTCKTWGWVAIPIGELSLHRLLLNCHGLNLGASAVGQICHGKAVIQSSLINAQTPYSTYTYNRGKANTLLLPAVHFCDQTEAAAAQNTRSRHASSLWTSC